MPERKWFGRECNFILADSGLSGSGIAVGDASSPVVAQAYTLFL